MNDFKINVYTLTPLPCPYCGTAPEVYPKRPELEGYTFGQVRCEADDCAANPVVHSRNVEHAEATVDDYRADAIGMWNTRLFRIAGQGDFIPCLIYHEHLDQSHIWLGDGPAIIGQEAVVRPLRDMSDRRVVGLQWFGKDPPPASGSQNENLPWSQKELEQGLILFRTSNNAHGFTNVSILSEKVDNLPLPAKRELANIMVNVALGLDPENEIIAAHVKAAGATPTSRVRHRKGGVYDVLGTGTIQWDTPLEDMAQVVIYRAADGTLWARAHAEFFDGRFEVIEHGDG